jgi:L-iditol 2-dehydrogenase
MQQGWLNGMNGPWEVREVPIPKPGPGQLLVKVHAGSICKQTDLNSLYGLHPPHDHQCWYMLPHDLRVWDNRLEGDPLAEFYPSEEFAYKYEPFPSRMGHEMAGEVVEIGPRTVPERSVMHGPPVHKIGDRVTGTPIFGGFGEYILMDVESAAIFPDTMSYEEGTLVEPVIMVNNTVRQVIDTGDVVLILGQGALGSIATMVAKARGASKIIVTDPVKSKRDRALKIGADIALDPAQGHIVNQILRLTDGGPNVVVEAAGVPATIQMIPYVSHFLGKVAQIGACCVPVLVDWSYIHFKGLTVVSQSGYMFRNLGWAEDAIILIDSGKADVKSLITHRFKLDQLAEAFAEAEKNDDMVKGMFIFD